MKPLTYKLQFREDENDHDFHDQYWDTGLGAAGCIFIAKDTARLLLAHRSNMVNEPGTWGTWGGKIDEDETIVQAITREVEEETGYDGSYKINHLWTFEDHDEGFQYHNYLVLVPNEFTPQLNWENEGSKWVEWGEWPSPMHFGLKALLQNAGDKLYNIIRLLKRKKADILDETMTTVPAQPPAIVQKVSAASAAVPVNITNAYVVAATLWGEARGEGQDGMQAVLNVLMNRAEGNFHKVAKIALSPKQFSMWNSVTNPADAALHMARRNQKDRQWNQAVQLVDQAMHGHLPDITGGAQFYFNPNKAQPSWAKEMVPTATIGHHEFFRPATPEDKKKKSTPKKVPSAITEMIEKQNPSDVVVFKKGIVSDGVWAYEMRSPFSFILYKFAPKIKTFYFDLIGTPNAGDQNQGHAKAILETFFQMVKQYKGVLDCDTYTTSGTYKIKPAIEKLAKKHGVRIVKGRTELNESLKNWSYDYWVHYSDVDYIKVNPNPEQSRREPRGIYLFPFKWDLTDTCIGQHWACKKYKDIVTIKSGLKIMDLNSLSIKDCAKIIMALGHKDKLKSFIKKDWEESSLNGYGKPSKIAMEYRNRLELGRLFWMFLKDIIFQNGIAFTNEMKKIGYDGIFAEANTIFTEEPQLIVFDDNNVKIVKVLPNDLDKRRSNPTAIEKLKNKLNRHKEPIQLGPSKVSEVYGDPGEHVVFGGIWYPDRIVAHIVKSRNDPVIGHNRDMGRMRWIYNQAMKTVFWHEFPDEQQENVVATWLHRRGYEVEDQRSYKDYYDLLLSMQKAQKKNEPIAEGISKDTPVVIGITRPDEVEAFAGTPDSRHPWDMTSGLKWRYIPDANYITFWGTPTNDERKRTDDWLESHGLKIMYVNIMREEMLNEGERTDYLDQVISQLEAEWDKLDSQGVGFDRQQQIRKELAPLQKERANWAKIYGAVDKAQNQGFATVKKQRKINVPQASV